MTGGLVLPDPLDSTDSGSYFEEKTGAEVADENERGKCVLTKRSCLILGSLSSLLWASASTGHPTPRFARSAAAGYKAGFLCSGLFNAGRTESQVDKDEFSSTLPEVQPLLGELKAEIDRERRMVSVAYDDTLPPRIAAWRPHLGCSQLPVGATKDFAALLPRLPNGLQPPHTDGLAWPMGDRAALAPPKGNRVALEKAVGAAFDQGVYAGSHTTAVLVIQNGKIVAERYRPDFDMHKSQRTWSAAKSIAATLAGVAVQQGKLDVNAPVPFPEWQSPGDPRAKITTDNLLRMASGLHEIEDSLLGIYFGGATVPDLTGAGPLAAPPNTLWHYSNSDTMMVGRHLRLVLGDQWLTFPFTELFWKIGMTHTVPETDWQGNYISSSQIWTTARDLGRFGLLYLNDGVWNGERILPEGWRDYVRREGPAQPPKGGRGGYGASFWTFYPEAGVPRDAFTAAGNRGQYVIMVPSRNVVIVRRGVDDYGKNLDLNRFTREILGALD